MTQDEFNHWKAVTDSGAHSWVEDVIRRLNGRGTMYYIGGEDGIYIDISQDGMLELGTYEGAIPHIGEAFFSVKTEKQCSSFDEAFKFACQIGGKRFLIDMFSGDNIPQEAAPENGNLNLDEENNTEHEYSMNM